MEYDENENIDLVHGSEISLLLTFHQLSPNDNEVTFIDQDYSIEEEWPNFEHLSGKFHFTAFSIRSPMPRAIWRRDSEAVYGARLWPKVSLPSSPGYL